MTEGAVFHPGHDELHGQTVVVYTSGPRTFIGRWDQDMGQMIRVVGATFHEEGGSDQTRDEWVQHVKKYGVPMDHEFVMVPKAEVSEVIKLREV